MTTEDCILWPGSIDRGTGYGRMSRGRYAHRVAYETHVGPIAPGLEIDHLCGVRSCVNPAHLEAVTRAEHLRRTSLRQTHCKRGHGFTPANTGRHKNGGRYCRECQNTYHQRAAKGSPPTTGGIQ